MVSTGNEQRQRTSTAKALAVPEILRAVLIHFRPDEHVDRCLVLYKPADLVNFCRINRAFCTEAQALLFQHILIERQPSGYALSWRRVRMEMLERNEPLFCNRIRAECVRELALWHVPSSKVQLLLKHCRNLRILGWTLPHVSEQILSEPGSFPPSLRKLNLFISQRRDQPSLSSWLDVHVLSTCPGLETLQVELSHGDLLALLRICGAGVRRLVLHRHDELFVHWSLPQSDRTQQHRALYEYLPLLQSVSLEEIEYGFPWAALPASVEELRVLTPWGRNLDSLIAELANPGCLPGLVRVILPDSEKPCNRISAEGAVQALQQAKAGMLQRAQSSGRSLDEIAWQQLEDKLLSQRRPVD